MSCVPFNTQGATQLPSQVHPIFVIVILDHIPEFQRDLLRECQTLLSHDIRTEIVTVQQLDMIPTSTRLFAIPNLNLELVKRIKTRFEKPRIYLPRAIIEALRFHQTLHLPVRSLSISMTMLKCRIFLVKNCDVPVIRNAINEMCGTIKTSFNEPDVNVVVSDRADDKYCSKAFHRRIPVVSPRWVEMNFNIAKQETTDFTHEASSNIEQFMVKPFYGLHFKIAVQDTPALKQLILSNQGNIVYGEENIVTHIVAPQATDSTKPKVVDVNFIETCAKLGFYVSKRDLRECNVPATPPQPVKQETRMHPTQQGLERQNDVMPPPSHFEMTEPRTPLRQQPADMNDMILRALSDNQTQSASTQMRRLPDRELMIEQAFEPSQQLFWNEKPTKK